ncbi:MAG: hypothetical protein ACREDI_03705, partial [Roseiarcus sp.]
MTADGGADSFGPYAFTLAPAEAEAAAARAGLRTALRGGLLASHFAPLTAFALIMAFASVLALTGLISRRAGEATLILAAAAFMLQRLATHWRIRRARREGRAAIERLQSAGALTATFDNETLSLDVDGRTRRLRYADCEAAEDAGGLIYVWPRDGAPIVLPTRALADAEEAARLLARLSGRIEARRPVGLAGCPAAIAPRRGARISTNRARRPELRLGSAAPGESG